MVSPMVIASSTTFDGKLLFRWRYNFTWNMPTRKRRKRERRQVINRQVLKHTLLKSIFEKIKRAHTRARRKKIKAVSSEITKKEKKRACLPFEFCCQVVVGKLTLIEH